MRQEGSELKDVRGLAADLSERLDAAGRRQELVELMVEGRRVLKGARALLRERKRSK